MTYAQQTKAIKAKMNNDKAFKALMSDWQKASAKGQTKLSFPAWYKAQRQAKLAKVDALVNSWMVA